MKINTWQRNACATLIAAKIIGHASAICALSSQGKDELWLLSAVGVAIALMLTLVVAGVAAWKGVIQ